MLGFEDLDDFFEMEDFAEPVVVGSGDSQVTINAIFDNAFYAEDESGYSKQASVQPMLTCKTLDIAPFPKGTQVIVRATTYKIVALRPDGTGITEVDLHKP